MGNLSQEARQPPPKTGKGRPTTANLLLGFEASSDASDRISAALGMAPRASLTRGQRSALSFTPVSQGPMSSNGHGCAPHLIS